MRRSSGDPRAASRRLVLFLVVAAALVASGCGSSPSNDDEERAQHYRDFLEKRKAKNWVDMPTAEHAGEDAPPGTEAKPAEPESATAGGYEIRAHAEPSDGSAP